MTHQVQPLSEASATPVEKPGRRFSFGVIGLLLVVAVALSAASSRQVRWLERVEVHQAIGYHEHLPPTEDVIPRHVLDAVELPLEYRVKRGQSLVGLLAEAGLDRLDAHAASNAVTRHLDPRRVRAGTSYAVYRRDDDSISKFVFTLAGQGEVHLNDVPDGWSSEYLAYEVTHRTHRVTGVLEGGLEQAVVAAGGPITLTYRLADVFQWDLDFNRDLRLGDRFSITYRASWVNGKIQSIDAIDAAIYENRGRVVEAFRYGEDGGYYDSDGRPLRKRFLRSPLPYSRVTSRFSNRRFHPILKKYRPHYGVDYGAPTGTPVRVTASGVVASAAWSKGGGKTIKVRHPNGYLTAYLHLSRYADGIKSGRRVSQGDVVGFVGSTGLSTGPHLDYRVQYQGRWIDPLSLKNEPAPPLEESELPAFFAERDRLTALLGALEDDTLLRSPVGERVAMASGESGSVLATD